MTTVGAAEPGAGADWVVTAVVGGGPDAVPGRGIDIDDAIDGGRGTFMPGTSYANCGVVSVENGGTSTSETPAVQI